MERRKIAALVLAAGYSSRMGDFKPLLPLGRSTVAEEVVGRFHRAGIQDVRVVTGHRADEMGPVVDRLGARKIFNADYDRGMYTSVLAGVRNLEAEIEAFFVLPVDIPLVKPATIAALAAAYRDSGASIVYPRFEGLRGHPPIISRQTVAELPDDCEGGLAAFLARFEDRAIDLDVIDQSILMNCNRRQDYLKLRARASREDVPTDRECMALLRARNASMELVSHSRLVAEVAGMLAIHLQCAGLPVDLELVKAGGLLHDLAKGLPDHSAAGAEMVEKIGCLRVARIVAAHTDIGQKDRRRPDESDIVHIADKLVKGDRLVGIEERFEGPLKKFAARPEAFEGVQRRLREAKAIKAQLESILGTPLEAIVTKYCTGMQAASNGPRKIYLARHGAVRHPGNLKCYIGHTDLPLSEEGRRQAQTLAEKLRGAPLSAIFCSDLRRSADTAGIIGNLHGIEPLASPNFREVALGEWEGLAFEEVRRRFPEEYEQRGRDIARYRPPGGESFLDCACRVIPAFFEAINSTRGDILLVAHAGVNRILLCRALGKSMSELFEIEQDYCCLNRIGYSDFAFELESLNEAVSPE